LLQRCDNVECPLGDFICKAILAHFWLANMSSIECHGATVHCAHMQWAVPIRTLTI
jgi:hypothetical protein